MYMKLKWYPCLTMNFNTFFTLRKWATSSLLLIGLLYPLRLRHNDLSKRRLELLCQRRSVTSQKTKTSWVKTTPFSYSARLSVRLLICDLEWLGCLSDFHGIIYKKLLGKHKFRENQPSDSSMVPYFKECINFQPYFQYLFNWFEFQYSRVLT
jgi:hypothetical protein